MLTGLASIYLRQNKKGGSFPSRPPQKSTEHFLNSPQARRSLRTRIEFKGLEPLFVNSVQERSLGVANFPQLIDLTFAKETVGFLSYRIRF
jgi:hypothetical protein